MPKYREPNPIKQRIEPFTYIVTDDVKKNNSDNNNNNKDSSDRMVDTIDYGDTNNSLLNIATHKVHIPLYDLLELNPEWSSMPYNSPLPIGTRLRLPVTPYYHGHGVGLYFVLGKEENKLLQCKERLDKLTTMIEVEEADTISLLSLPKRSVRSKTEQVLAVIHEETTRQLPIITEAYDRVGRKDQTLHYLVDVNPVKEKEKQIQDSFSHERVNLHSYSTEAQEVMSLATQSMSENYLTPASMQTVLDGSDDFCVHHSHRWEFVFYGPNSVEEQDAWAVLSCEPLTALLDAFTCNLALPFSSTTSTLTQTTSLSESSTSFSSSSLSVLRKPPLSNAFLFIGGVFYIDDRHCDESEYEDFSNVIRCFNPLTGKVNICSPNTEEGDDNANTVESIHNNITSITNADSNETNNWDMNCIVANTKRQRSHMVNEDINTDNTCNEFGNADSRSRIEHINSFHTLSNNSAFGSCPVRSAATTTFASLHLRQGEYGVLRHLGECNHYFYLHKVTQLSSRFPRKERDQFPHRVMRRREKVVRCQMCKLFPSTVALYGDPLSPHDPALYCATCYTLLHGNETKEEASQYLKIIPSERGDYFKC